MPEGSQVPADFVAQFGRVVSSSLASEPDTGANTAVLFSVEGAGVVGAVGETDQEAEVFGALGVVGRPLEPETVAGRSAHAEVLCLRTADGLVPISARDLRLRMQGDGPAAGTLAFVGYGGGFHSLSPVGGDPTLGTIHVIYCPYNFDSAGVAQKAHTIVLDPTSGNESVSIVHARGQSILLQDDGTARMQSVDGQSYVQVKDKEVAISADQLVLNGTVVVGNPVTPVPLPLLAGPASPPCPRLFLSSSP